MHCSVTPFSDGRRCNGDLLLKGLAQTPSERACLIQVKAGWRAKTPDGIVTGKLRS
ncbi:hypothetical protein SPHINGOR109_30388 [Sphingorhabdus sp. 109]|nr:hypothetical protein SPHINGOR109_30388 [Sphingorhabdus sp. 109]